MKTTYMLNNMPLEIDYEFLDTNMFDGCPYVEIDGIAHQGHSIDVRGLEYNGQDLVEFLSKELLKRELPE